MLAPIRFLWNSTRGHRLAFWRSALLRWRIETFTGKPAETLTVSEIFAFFWQSRWELLRYLVWIDRLEKEVRRKA